MKVILSLCGGGMRGLIPCVILERLEKEIGAPLHTAVDMVAGTSTGGILASLLTCPLKHPAASLKDFYYNDGPKIFSSSIFRKAYTLVGSIHSRYKFNPLADCLANYMTSRFMARDLLDTLNPQELDKVKKAAAILRRKVGPYTIDEALKPLLIATYDKNTPGPVFLKSYDPYWKGLELATAARATASAPTYFPSCDFKHNDQDYALIDGGVFANNPTMCALADGIKLWGPSEDIMIVNLDTGTLKNQRDAKKITANGGLATWAPVITEVCMDGSHDTAAYQAKQVLGEDRFFHFQVTLDKMHPMDDSSKATLDNYKWSTEKALDTYLYESFQKVVTLIKSKK